MDIKQLEYFVRVGELGSFSKAATALSVGQPFLSKHIRQLEVELHENLFHRNGRFGLSFTESGTLFYSHAKKVLEQLHVARRELDELKVSPSGKLVVGTVPDARCVLAQNLVSAFLGRYPQATLEIVEEKSGAIYQWLLDGRVNLGVLYDPLPTAQIRVMPLLAHELYLVSSAQQKLVPPSVCVEFCDLARFPLILPNHNHALRRQVEAHAASAGIRLNVRLEILGAAFILELVEQGHGCTILSSNVARGEHFSQKFQINAIVNPQLTKTLVLATPANRPPTRLVRETAELLAGIIIGDAPPYARRLPPAAA